MFDPFYTTKGNGGTGLGLSQIYDIIEHCKGTIQAYSEPGHGTQITLYFPHYNQKIANENCDDNITSTNLQGTETILIVDDEPALVQLSSTILEQQGYRVLTANDGKQVLKVLEGESVDLVISDVIMSEMDGYALANILQEKYPKVKIQLASGFSDDRHQDMIDKSLHENLLPKPYHSQSLLNRRSELLAE